MLVDTKFSLHETVRYNNCRFCQLGTCRCCKQHGHPTCHQTFHWLTHTHTHTFWTLQTSRTSSRLKTSRTGFLFSSSSLFHVFLASTNPVPLTYPNKLLLALPNVRSAKQDLTLNSTEFSLGLAMKQCAHYYTRGLWIHQCFSFCIIQISTAVKCFCFIFVCLFVCCHWSFRHFDLQHGQTFWKACR